MPLTIDKNLYNTLDFLPEGYFVIDDNFKVIYWNKSLELLTDIDKVKILNTKLENTFPNFKQELYKRRINPIFKGGPPVVFSAKLHKNLFTQYKSQNEYYYQVTISSLRITEEKYHALFSIENRSKIYNQFDELINLRDKALNEVDEKEKINTKLIDQHAEIQKAFSILTGKNLQIEKQKQQLLELNATKDKFFSIIAHDLINPLSALMGYSSLIVDSFNTYTLDEIKQMMGVMNDSIKQTFDLLQNLLQWSRAQSGKLENNPVKVDLKEIADNNIKLFTNNILEKNIEIKNLLPDKLLVYVDKDMINTIFRNLISNAIKFTPKGENINIVHEQQTEDIEQKGKFVIISVNDTGIGIEPGDMKKLFRIEETLTTVGTNNEKGTGLGLLLCKEFAEIIGGDIWAKSKIGKGSSFYVKIPV